MIRLALAFALTLGLPAAAQGVFVSPPDSVMNPPGLSGDLSGKRLRVAHELRLMGFGNVDIAGMSNRKVALLDNAIHSGRPNGERLMRVRSILSGGGLLQRGLDRLSRP